MAMNTVEVFLVFYSLEMTRWEFKKNFDLSIEKTLNNM